MEARARLAPLRDDLVAAGEGRPSAEELCETYASRVHQFARMVARGDAEAEDLAQSALERALRALPRFDATRGDLAAWLWRIVVNVARDAGRAALRRELLVARLATLRESRPPADDIPTGISDERLLDAVRRLTPMQRSLIALRFGADLTHADAGAALGLSPVAARVAMHRALAALRADLSGEKR